MKPLAPSPSLPDITVFEDGDILLTFAGAVQSWGIAYCQDPNAGLDDVPYSHAEILFRDTHGKWMLSGVSGGHVQTRLFSSAIKHFQHTAVYRIEEPRSKRNQISHTLNQWLKDPVIKNASFDYALQDVPGRKDRFCCVSFVNELFREVGLEAPFTTESWTPNAFGRHLEQIMNLNLDTITSVESVKRNPNYTCILKWQNDRMNPTAANINKTVARYGFQMYEQGWQLRMSQGTNLLLLMIDLPQGIENTVRVRAHIKLFVKDVTLAWQRLYRRNQLEGLDETEKQDRLVQLCDLFRDRHMVFVGSDANEPVGVQAVSETH